MRHCKRMGTVRRKVCNHPAGKKKRCYRNRAGNLKRRVPVCRKY